MKIRLPAPLAALLWAAPLSASAADGWSFTTRGTLYYTDDVGIFSATRRLTRDADPTQPAIDSRLTGQGSDGVFEPVLEVTKSFQSRYGTTSLDALGDGFVFFDHTRYSNGTLRLQGRQDFSPKTRMLVRYYYNPDLFLGENVERRSGTEQTAAERVSSRIGLLRMEQELAEGVGLVLLGRYGNRRYNQAFSERNTDFWTLGSHLELQVAPAAKLALAYHYERGIADGHDQPQFADDVSYANNYVSVDLDVELLERLTLSTAFHFEHNDWLSTLEGDERNGAFEDVYQGDVLLEYACTDRTRAYAGVQYSSRKESFEAEGISNTNVGLGVQSRF
jgi:hypothetical protein